MKKHINRYISVLYRYGQRFFAQKLKSGALPIDVAYIPYLMQLYRCPGITQEGISSNIGVDKGTTARCMASMEECGLVERRTDENDRRINHIFATQKAMMLRNDVYNIIDDLHKILYKGFSEEEIDSALLLLLRMKDNMKNYMEIKK